MRAVKGSLGHSPKERCREFEGAHSTRALEDQPGYPVKRKESELGKTILFTRAVEDQSAPIPEEITSELGGIICNLARRPQWD